MVEHLLAKEGVAGSNPVFRSISLPKCGDAMLVAAAHEPFAVDGAQSRPRLELDDQRTFVRVESVAQPVPYFRRRCCGVHDVSIIAGADEFAIFGT